MGTAFGKAFHFHPAAVLLNDVVAHRKAESGTDTLFLRGEKGIENLVDDVRVDAGTVVDDVDAGFAGAAVGSDGHLQAAAVFHGAPDGINQRIGAIMVGIPSAWREEATPHLDVFLGRLGFKGPVIDYRRYVGEFASASAVAAVIALALLERGTVPGPLAGGREWPMGGRGILLLGLGATLSTMLAESSSGIH